MELEHLRILEGKSLLWDDITAYYKSKIDAEDYILMHGIDMEIIKRLTNTKPFFSERYIIELHVSRVTSKLLNQLTRIMKTEWITLIVVCTTKDDFEMVGTIIRKSFNGYKISYKYWLGYVTKRLDCQPRCNLEAIYKTLNGRYELTEFIIDVINKTGGNIKLVQVNKLIGKRDKMSLDLLWFSILRMDMKSKRDVFKYLEEYRYGYTFIHNALKDKYAEMLEYYRDFHNGLLNELNMREYKKEKHISEWILKSYISLFSCISFDEILLIGEMIECSNVNSTAKMFELIGRLYGRHSGLGKVV